MIPAPLFGAAGPNQNTSRTQHEESKFKSHFNVLLLVRPVQRIMKYPLLINEIVKGMTKQQAETERIACMQARKSQMIISPPSPPPLLKRQQTPRFEMYCAPSNFR